MLLINAFSFAFLNALEHGFIKKLDKHVDRRFEQRQQINEHAIAELQLKSQQMLDKLQQFDAQRSQLFGQSAEAQGHQQALETFYQALIHDRERLTLREIQHMLLIANETLPLTGDVSLAVGALESADARLAAFNSARVKAVRNAIAHDLAVFKAMPIADITGLADALDHAYQQVDTLPFIGDTAPTAAVPTTFNTINTATATITREDSDWRSVWARFSEGILHQLTSLVQVHRLDHADAIHIAPDQRVLLRENLKLQLVSARLSLLSRHPKTLETDLRNISKMIERYLDLTSSQTQSLRELIQQVDQASQNLELPDLNTSLSALRQSEVQK